MSTSVNAAFARRGLRYLTWTVFFAVFGAVYELFGHEIYSYYMIYAFAFPLLLGAVPCAVLSLSGREGFGELTAVLWECAVITLAVGSSFRGVLEIYGTSNRLVTVYPVAAAAVFLSAILLRKK